MDNTIPIPFRFNPLKHHLSWMKAFIRMNLENSDISLTAHIRHLGSSVMDVYTGSLNVREICEEIKSNLDQEGLFSRESFSRWSGKGFSDFRIIKLSDGSQWTLKNYSGQVRYIHFFPSRSSPHTFRVKANTLKSAILYIIIAGKDYISEKDLNMSRSIAGLPPVKEVSETEAISEMIEMLRNE